MDSGGACQRQLPHSVRHAERVDWDAAGTGDGPESEFTSRVDGAPAASAYRYGVVDPQLGVNLRWGVTQNLSWTGTVNPDFSQVEADVGQVTVNERFAVFFPEKRPFFLEGLEQFDTPNALIYTRRISAPVGGAKIDREDRRNRCRLYRRDR